MLYNYHCDSATYLHVPVIWVWVWIGLANVLCRYDVSDDIICVVNQSVQELSPICEVMCIAFAPMTIGTKDDLAEVELRISADTRSSNLE